MEMSYIQWHIMLSSSKGAYIRIGPFLATSKCSSDIPLEFNQNCSSEWETSQRT